MAEDSFGLSKELRGSLPNAAVDESRSDKALAYIL